MHHISNKVSLLPSVDYILVRIRLCVRFGPHFTRPDASLTGTAPIHLTLATNMLVNFNFNFNLNITCIKDIHVHSILAKILFGSSYLVRVIA